MNELDSLMGGVGGLELSDLQPSQPPLQLPKAAIRNRAATLSLLAEGSDNPEKLSQNYQLMMAEGDAGSDSFTKQTQQRVQEHTTKEDNESFMSILSDPSVSFVQKEQLIKDMRLNPALKDTRMKLYTTALQQASPGETPEAEDARVGSATKALEDAYQENITQQGLVNAFVANLEGIDTAGQYAERFGEAAALWIAPFGYSASAVRLHKALNQDQSFWKTLKNGLLPGSAIAEIRKDLENLTGEERIAFSQQIRDKLQASAGVVFGADNQFSQAEKAQQIFDEGGYSTTQEWMDNIASLLDVIGLGALVRLPARGAKAAAKLPTPSPAIPGAPRAATEAPTAPQPATAGVQQSDLASVTGKPTAGAYDSRIKELEDKKANLLGVAGNQLARREVTELETERKAIVQSFKDFGTEAQLAKDIQASEGITSKAAKERAAKIYAERKATHESTLARIDGMLETNRESSTVVQQVAELEKQIDMLNKRNTPIFLQKSPIADAISRIELNGVVRIENPSSPHATIKQANPQKARDLHEAIVSSEGDAVAEALTGVGKQQAVVNDVFPQAGTASGKVTAQPVDIQRNLRMKALIPEKIHEFIWSTGRVDITAAEKAAVRANVVRNFRSAEGLTMNEAMGSFTTEGGRIKISAAYGTPEGSFVNAKEALDQAEFALRKMGVRRDELELLRKEGNDFVPVKLEDATEDGAYMVRVNTFHEIDPTDIAEFDKFGVKLNFFDRFSAMNWGSSGSFARHLVDAASMLDKRLTGAASNVSDQGAQLEKLMLGEATRFSDLYAKLGKTGKGRVDSYIQEANLNGLAYDQFDLMARGFSAAEINAVKVWREYWDANYYLENLDMVRTLNAQGYQSFKNKNAELFAKPVAKNQNYNTVYDPDIDAVVIITKQEMDDLYNIGGTVARLRRTTDFGGTNAEYMIVRNSPTSYLRKIRDSDIALNYREGYYNIQYQAPRFVDEIQADGTRRAIAVAGDTLEAQHFATRMQRNAQKGERYEIRSDDRAMRKDSDDWFDIESARGRVAQRHRGKTLEDGAGMNHLGDGSYIMDPVSSAVRAAKSISGRTVSRPMLETAKARFLKQYDEFLPSDGMGGKLFPSSVGQIGKKGVHFKKSIADARTTWEYIRYLENGYLNGIDNWYKAFMHWSAEEIGEIALKTNSKTLAKVERAAESLSGLGPTQTGKGLVFAAYLGTNPLRQWIIQTHQATRTWFYNPEGWARGEIPKLMTSYINIKMGEAAAVASKEAHAFAKFVDDSGVMAAVDKQNLVRGSLADAADHTNAVVRGAVAPLNFLRRIGFDTGERGNMLGHMAAVYDKYKAAGKDLKDLAVRDEAYAEARALSYDMNFAGDLPYNQNSAGMVLQFMQVPHKAMLQLTNRRLDPYMRLRLMAGDLVFWGPPTALISTVFGDDILPEDPELREAFVFGLESMLLNHSIRMLTKDDKLNIDFSSLAPSDMTGWGEFFVAMYEGGFLQMGLNSPSGALLKSDGRVQNAVKSMARMFGFQEPIEETPDTFLQVVNEVLSISSGWSNGMKAYLALKSGERYDKYGQAIDTDTHPVEAVMEAFGFTDASRRDLFMANKKAIEMTKQHKEDVTKDVKLILDYVTKNVVDVDNRKLELIQRSTAFALSRYKDDPIAQEIFRQQLMYRLGDANTGLLRNLLKASGLPNAGELKDTIRMSSLPEEQKQLLIQRIEDVENLKESE